MKTATKVILIIALVLVLVGILSCVLGLLFGGSFAGLWPARRLDLTDVSQDFGADLTGLDIQVAAGKFYLETGDSFHVEAKNVHAGSFTCAVEGDRLVIREDWKNFWFWGFFSLGRQAYTPTVVITIPEKALKTVELEISAGELSLCDLETDEFALDMYAGALYAGRILAGRTELNFAAGKAEIGGITGHSADIEVSAGGFEIGALAAPELELDVSAGSLEISGIVSRQVSADCSAGQMDLHFLQPRTDYFIQIEVSAGKVEVDGESYARNQTYLGEESAPGRMELEVSAGEIQVDFQ